MSETLTRENFYTLPSASMEFTFEASSEILIENGLLPKPNEDAIRADASVVFTVDKLISAEQEDELKSWVKSGRLSGYKLARNIAEGKTEITLSGVNVEMDVSVLNN